MIKKALKKLWYYLWHDDSIVGWVVTVIISFIFVKYIFLPGLGLLLGTPFPVVAVVSSSMEHNGQGFDAWWAQNAEFYQEQGITKEQFKDAKFTNGFNKGDVMVLYRVSTPKVGDVIVFQGNAAYPIIHRVIQITPEGITTKGDNNPMSRADEKNIATDRVYGKAVCRLPLLGWFKIGFVNLLKAVGIA